MAKTARAEVILGVVSLAGVKGFGSGEFAIEAQASSEHHSQSATGALRPPNATRGFESPELSHAKTRPKGRVYAWLELRYGNITFADELDFDLAELDIVYEDNNIEVSQCGVHMAA